MKAKILIMILSALVVGCVAPLKVAYNWESFESVEVAGSSSLPVDFNTAWDAVTRTASDMQMTPIAKIRDSGILTFVRTDKKYSNATHQITVRLMTDPSENETQVWLRAFVFTLFKKSAGNVFPSDGSIENEFMEKLRENI